MNLRTHGLSAITPVLQYSNTPLLHEFSGLPRFIFLGEFTFESILADAGAIELSHDKSVFVDEITDRLIPVLDALEPLVLVHVALDELDLGGQDVLQVSALVEHGSIHPFLKSLKL